MKRFRKYTVRVLAVLLGTVLLAMIAVYSYVSINKQKIINEVTADLSKKIDGKVTIGNIELSFLRNFPRMSVLLKDLRVTDSLYAQHRHPFFEAREVYALISVPALLRKQPPLNGLRIDHATVYMFTDADGYTNKYLLKSKKEGANKSEKQSRLQYVILNHFRFMVEDKTKNKLHDLLVRHLDMEIEDQDKQSVQYTTEADIQVQGLAFNRSRGAYIKGKRFRSVFEMRFDKQHRRLQFDSIQFKLDNQSFNMTGAFDLGGDAPQFKFRLHTRSIVYDIARSMLTERLARSMSVVEVANPVNVSAEISGPLKGGTPLVKVFWDTRECRLVTPFLDVDEASFSGYFSNEVVAGLPRKDPNSTIVLNDFKANWHGLPLHSKHIELLDLSNPVISCDLRSEFELVKLNEVIGTNSLQFSSGSAVANLKYKGPLHKKDSSHSSLNGTLAFRDGHLLYTVRNVELQHVHATMWFNDADVFIENLQASVFGNRFEMQVMAKNLITMINSNPENINIDWNIYSPALKLDSFTYLLQPARKLSRNNYSKKNIVALASTIDNILYNGKLRVDLKAAALSYRKFQAENVLANFSIHDDKYTINNAGMRHAGGQLTLGGSLVPAGQNNLANVKMQVKNVDVRKMLRAFENFGQDGITDQNLEGKLTADVNASLLMNSTGKIDPSSILSTVNFSLKEGMLNNYEPIKKLQKLVFKKRDFDSIRFAELKNRLDIANREVKINRMEIQSSVLSMFVEGVYSQRGNTDISIQVPLSNLKKRDSTFIPENIGVDKKGGKSIYLRGRPGPDGDIKFNLDLFKKYERAK